SGLDPAARLGAMIETYFDPRLFTRDKLAAWFTFWSDAELRERYRAAAMRLERRYTRELERELRRLLAAGGLDLRSAPPIVATLAAMIDGFWLQAMLNPRDFDREAAVAACIAFLELRLSRVGASPRPRRRAQPSVASAGLARIERPG
ncbi:MAG TPA: TetR family transcriptional regulator C-terminal domain-containing protein, partial [Dongiaceae bacterium]|nr:TetR family transcriptional regulator C-terminal domain-containing protein [Dongiaceae bacterium]